VGSPVAWTVAVVMAAVLAGCASRADLLEIERRMDTRMQEQARSIHDVQLEVERIRAATEGRAPGAVPRAGLTKPLARKPDKDRGLATDKGAPRIESPSQEIGMTPVPEGTSTEGGAPPPAQPSPAPAEAQPGSPPSEPHSGGPPPHPVVEESWKREVEQDRAVASTMNVSERAEYMGALARLAKGDCAKAAGRLDAVSSDAKGSPLADNALYWQARCDAARGNNGQAESRYRDIVARYPKSDKAPAPPACRGRRSRRDSLGTPGAPTDSASRVAASSEPVSFAAPAVLAAAWRSHVPPYDSCSPFLSDPRRSLGSAS
jgi:TolA-binding protein